MEYNTERKEIINGKILNELDRFTLDFVKILEKHIDYVIVSGYVAILLGRSRASEDVDLLIPEMEFSKFKDLFEDLDKNGFECANTSNPREAYDMLDSYAIRFFKEGLPIPNMEFKKITDRIHKEAFDNRLRVILGEEILYISPLELQIAYKLTLIAPGEPEELHSDKDFDDAKHIFETFKNKLNMEKIIYFVDLFKVRKMWEFFKDE